MATQSFDALVVGAGVAGLACARDLRRAGRSVLVVDRGRSVGGRCSTWRAADGHRLDYGVTFLHGSDRGFLAEIDRLEGQIDGWPRRVRGSGAPCQPRAFAARERRVGLRQGVSALPKALAADLDVRVETTVQRLGIADGGFAAVCDSGTLTAEALVLAVACEQARALLGPLAEEDAEIAGINRVLGMLGTVPCLTLMATFDAPPPDWDVMFPDASSVIQLVANESSKRPEVAGSALVVQGRPAWSSTQLEQPPERWGPQLLGEAVRLLGDWASTPIWSRHHRWRYARTDLATELSEPILLRRRRRCLGLTGELFARGAGVEAAFLAGRALARRILGDDHD